MNLRKCGTNVTHVIIFKVGFFKFFFNLYKFKLLIINSISFYLILKLSLVFAQYLVIKTGHLGFINQISSIV